MGFSQNSKWASDSQPAHCYLSSSAQLGAERHAVAGCCNAPWLQMYHRDICLALTSAILAFGHNNCSYQCEPTTCGGDLFKFKLLSSLDMSYEWWMWEGATGWDWCMVGPHPLRLPSGWLERSAEPRPSGAHAEPATLQTTATQHAHMFKMQVQQPVMLPPSPQLWR